MQWFRVAYCKISHEWLDFRVYTRAFRQVCMYTKKNQVTNQVKFLKSLNVCIKHFVVLPSLVTGFSEDLNLRMSNSRLLFGSAVAKSKLS